MIWTNVRPAVSRPAVSRPVGPAVNTLESAENYLLELALPGWEKGQVDLRVDGELLIVSGEIPKVDSQHVSNYRRREFGITKFEKSFHLPETVDVDSINATLDHGVLTIELPKVAEVKPVRKAIAIA